MVPQQPPNDADAVLLHEVAMEVGQFVRREQIARPSPLHVREPSVREAGNRFPRVSAEEMDVLHHFLRTGGAVQPDGIQVVRCPAR